MALRVYDDPTELIPDVAQHGLGGAFDPATTVPYAAPPQLPNNRLFYGGGGITPPQLDYAVKGRGLEGVIEGLSKGLQNRQALNAYRQQTGFVQQAQDLAQRQYDAQNQAIQAERQRKIDLATYQHNQLAAYGETLPPELKTFYNALPIDKKQDFVVRNAEGQQKIADMNAQYQNAINQMNQAQTDAGKLTTGQFFLGSRPVTPTDLALQNANLQSVQAGTQNKLLQAQGQHLSNQSQETKNKYQETELQQRETLRNIDIQSKQITLVLDAEIKRLEIIKRDHTNQKAQKAYADAIEAREMVRGFTTAVANGYVPTKPELLIYQSITEALSGDNPDMPAIFKKLKDIDTRDLGIKPKKQTPRQTAPAKGDIVNLSNGLKFNRRTGQYQ